MSMIKLKEIIVMGDLWDYKLRKMEWAWDLASRIIPAQPTTGGRWTEDAFITKAQAVMKEAYDAIDAVFANN